MTTGKDRMKQKMDVDVALASCLLICVTRSSSGSSGCCSCVLAATSHSHPSQQLVPDLNDVHNCVGKLVFACISSPSGISGLQHVAGVAQRPDIESEDTRGAQQTRRA